MMNEHVSQLWDIFDNHSFNLWLVGGAVRDILLNKAVGDLDFATDASPQEVLEMLKDRYAYSSYAAKYGCITISSPLKCQITTLRHDIGYKDKRHPDVVQFVNDIEQDVKRRDFTVNGLYMNRAGDVIDLVNGLQHLQQGLLVVIGDPVVKINEDPLRIVRALRFCADNNFTLEETLSSVIDAHHSMLKYVSKQKILAEIRKIKNKHHPLIEKYLKEYLT
jgi:tRNA nucleotidyltransferase (CCA-adding enzyme)